MKSFNTKILEASLEQVKSYKKPCLSSKEDWKMSHSYIYEIELDIDIFACTFIKYFEIVHNNKYTNFLKDRDMGC